MNKRHFTKQGPGSERGAALVVAIAIMTILLAIALTFYAVSRREVDNANNVRNTVQADLLVDSALAMAMAELNRDFLKHPNATSNDFRPFAFFNGSWVAGKEWALPLGPLQNGGVPLINLPAMPDVQFPDGRVEQLFTGPRTQDWLYYPRIEGGVPYRYSPTVDLGGGVATNQYLPNDPQRPPFVTPAFFGAGAFYDSGANAIIPSGARYPLEWIHTWTDVDNDGDGLNDALWIPIPQDRFLSGGERNGEDQFGNPLGLYNDGVDNDLDGMVDENQEFGQDHDGDGNADDFDEAMELGSFVYWGGNDQLDNDGVNGIDDAGEQKYFLTAPLPGLRIPLDLNADGHVPDFVPNAAGTGLVELQVQLPNSITVRVSRLDPNDPAYLTDGQFTTVTLNASDVDVLDNDYDMLINDFQVYAYIGPNTGSGPPFRLSGFKDTGVIDPATGFSVIQGLENLTVRNSAAVDAGLPNYYNNWQLVGNWYPGDADRFQVARLKAYEEVNTNVVFAPNGGLSIFPAQSRYFSELTGGYVTFDYTANLTVGAIRITHSGEPVCDLAGRAAITVTDENSKVNMNVAGAHQYDPLLDGVVRALGDGVSTGEYETRSLPDIGAATAADFWAQRMGTPPGNPAGWDPSIAASYFSDIIHPGFGRVDDNANALVSAFDGVDNDGDGLIDEGVFLPELSPLAESFLAGAVLNAANQALVETELLNTRYLEYYAQLGAFEGIDDHSEHQRFRPLPNLQAEGRNPFKVSPGLPDDRDNDLDGAVNERGELGDLQLQDTLQLQDVFGFASGRYGIIRQSVSAYSTDRNVNFFGGSDGVRAINKLDYNFATPQQIAGNLIIGNAYEAVTARFPNTTVSWFAEGLRRSDVHTRASFGGLMNGTITTFAADPVLQALQAAVDIVDNRDKDHSRSVLTTERRNRVPQTAALAVHNYDIFPERLSARERIKEEELFPLGEIEDYLRQTMALSRKLEIRDDWWSFEAGVLGASGTQLEERQISYTATGSEAIRINEIMVRPVRRVEAEAVPNPLLLGLTDPMTPPILLPTLTPITNFDPTPFGNTGPAILPEFNVVREAQAGWALNNGGVLGDASWLQTSTSGSILQFRIAANTGLPAGRYYLTVDTLDSDFTNMQLEYAIKYDNGTDIITNGPGAFVAVPAQHYAQNVAGAPNGWAFLNGTVPTVTPGYFIDGGGSLPAPVVGNSPTFTVTVPPVGAPSGDLLIGIRMVGVGTLRINALDFSQEPDHEWLELVNVSDETVNIGGWELEVGIPDRPGVPRDPFKSNWKIPLNTEVAPRGMVLLAINKFDTYRDGPANFRIADNGMGLADGDPLPFTGNLLTDTLTLPPIADNSPFAAAVPAVSDVTGSVFRRKVNPVTNALTDYNDADGDGRSSLYAAAARAQFPGIDNLPNDQAVQSSKELGTLLSSADGNLPWERIVQLEPQFSIVTTNNPFTASPSEVRLIDITGVDDVAAFVLRGGVFPNYPERDGYDNDGDGGYVLFEQRDERIQASGGAYDVGVPGSDGPDWIDASEVPGVPYQYVRGTLDMDMVDNDFDGFIDEQPYQGDPYGIGVESSFFRAYLSEGVDEGAGLYNNTVAIRRFGAGSYEEGRIPMGIFPNRANWNIAYDPFAPIPNPGITVDISPNIENLRYAIDTIPVIYGDSATIPGAINTFYHGSDADPIDWKAFAERRWYPGDNVIVTLYEGIASQGRVVDRVTYNQLDVINRTIDDVGPNRYVALDLDLSGTVGDSLIEIPGLNRLYPTMWLPNHMGLDWYRSLERKHPLYNGDRFGTENRWQATDGNYDDWADSLSWFEGEIATTNGPVAGTDAPVFAGDQITDVRPRFVAHPTFVTDLAYLARNAQLYGHAMAGTPLRMNSATRRGENPLDVELVLAGAPVPRQFPGFFDHFRSHEDGDYAATGTPSLPDQRWNLSRSLVANRAFQTAGDVMRVPHQMYLHDAINTLGGDAFLRDMTLINYNIQRPTDGIVPNGISWTQDIALRSATLGQDPTDAGNSENILTAAVNSMATDSFILTMGQAEFRPILPDAAAIRADSSIVDWVPNLTTGITDDFFAPAAWSPVFLFGLGSPTDDPRANLDLFPNYPSFVNGENASTTIGLHFLFNQEYLQDVGNFGGVDISSGTDYTDRWPLEQRTAMYVSQRRDTTLAPPEALFTWDGADGLENGEYILYIGTYLPKMGERLVEAAGHAAQVQNVSTGAVSVSAKSNPALLNLDPTTPANNTGLTLRDGSVIPVDPITKSIILRDPTYTNSTEQEYDPVYAIDVITDPTEARGQAPLASSMSGATQSQKPPGLIHPGDWNPTIQYKAGPDGYIFYGNNAVGGWKPQIVRVTDNFLALRVRNVGNPGQVGALTHIVLAPRKKTAGRVNVNTARSRVATVARGGARHEYFSALLGLPGVVDVARTVQPRNPGATVLAGAIPPNDDIPLMTNAVLPPETPPGSGYFPWTPPGGPTLSPPQFFYGPLDAPPARNVFFDAATPDTDLLVPDIGLSQPDAHRLGAFRLNAMIMAGRTEHADGRYYESVGDLVQDRNAFDYNYVLSQANPPQLGGGITDGVEDFARYPLSNESDPGKRFDEVQARFQRLGNLVTTRSDVYQIIMTVEAGYGVDRNGDGFINYRSADEFVTTARTKATAVYERRSPSDQLDVAE